MATVPANPSFQDVINVFGGNGELYYYYRGGPFVPNIPANAGVPDSPGALTLAHLAGSTNYVPLSVSANGVSSFGSQKGTFTVGTSTCNISGGNGNVSYSLSFVSGDQFAYSQGAANQATFRATNVVAGENHLRGVYRWTVSDGISSATADFTVAWN